MSYIMYCDMFDTGELTGTAKSCHVISKANQIIKKIVVPVVVIGEPVITNLRAKIYGNNETGNTPILLLRTSTNSYNKADIVSVGNHGFNHLYFLFDDICVSNTQEFHVVLEADVYTPSTDNQMGWQNAWPDPTYTTNYTVTGNNFLASPLKVAIFGESF